MTPETTSRSTAEIAPFITAAVGDVSRPAAGLPLTASISHIPGESGLWAGIRTLAGWTRSGVVHVRDEHRKHGPIFRSMFGNLPFVSVSDPELFAQIAKNEDKAWSAALAWRVFFEGVDPSSSTLDSPVMLDFELHKDARKVLQPAFSAAATARYLEIAAPMFERAIERWLRAGTIAFKPEIRRLLAEVSTRIFTGVEDPAEAALLDRALSDFWAAPLALSHSPWLSPTWRRAMRGHAALRNAFRPRVAERKKKGGDDLFSRLCVAASGESWLDDDTIVRLFIGVMAGAFDTTSLGLSSMAYLLGRHTEWRAQLEREARGLDGRFTPDDAKKLELTDRVWKETMRLYPITSNLPRRALRDVELGGHRIPAGTLVLAVQGAMFRDPKWWTDPERFDPDRFSDERAEDRRHKGAFLPFGSGAHACVGMHLAGLEVKAFWHVFLRRCRFQLERDEDVGHTYGPLGSVKGDVRMRLEPA